MVRYCQKLLYLGPFGLLTSLSQPRIPTLRHRSGSPPKSNHSKKKLRNPKNHPELLAPKTAQKRPEATTGDKMTPEGACNCSGPAWQIRGQRACAARILGAASRNERYLVKFQQRYQNSHRIVISGTVGCPLDADTLHSVLICLFERVQ
jgi:hypothetical protein